MSTPTRPDVLIFSEAASGYRVEGDGGVITLHNGLLNIHSRTPLRGAEPGPATSEHCPALGGAPCWGESSGYLARLLHRYAQNDHDRLEEGLRKIYETELSS